MTELSGALDSLKQVLSDIEAHLVRKDPPPEALEDFKMTLDTVRTSVLAIAIAQNPADQNAEVRKLRLQRAAQICQVVSEGMEKHAIEPSTPGFPKLRSSVQESLERLAQLIRDSRALGGR